MRLRPQTQGGGSSSSGIPGDASIDLVKFNRVSELIPFVGRVFDRQPLEAADQTAHKFTVVNVMGAYISAVYIFDMYIYIYIYMYWLYTYMFV